MYIHGGHDSTNWLNDLLVFDTKKCIWKEIITLNEVN